MIYSTKHGIPNGKKNDFNKLLQFFIKKIDNSKDLNKDNRIELFRTFFSSIIPL